MMMLMPVPRGFSNPRSSLIHSIVFFRFITGCLQGFVRVVNGVLHIFHSTPLRGLHQTELEFMFYGRAVITELEISAVVHHRGADLHAARSAEGVCHYHPVKR